MICVSGPLNATPTTLYLLGQAIKFVFHFILVCDCKSFLFVIEFLLHLIVLKRCDSIFPLFSTLYLFFRISISYMYFLSHSFIFILVEIFLLLFSAFNKFIYVFVLLAILSRMCGSVGNFEIGKVMISVTAVSGRILSQVCCFAWCISVVIILGFCILFFSYPNFLQLNVSEPFFSYLYSFLGFIHLFTKGI